MENRPPSIVRGAGHHPLGIVPLSELHEHIRDLLQQTELVMEQCSDEDHDEALQTVHGIFSEVRAAVARLATDRDRCRAQSTMLAGFWEGEAKRWEGEAKRLVNECRRLQSQIVEQTNAITTLMMNIRRLEAHLHRPGNMVRRDAIAPRGPHDRHVVLIPRGTLHLARPALQVVRPLLQPAFGAATQEQPRLEQPPPMEQPPMDQ